MIRVSDAAQSAAAPQPCSIERFPHALPHRDEARLRPCGHWACEPHTITYYGRGIEDDEREGEYCMVCYERTFPGMCPDKVLRAAIHQIADPSISQQER
jgi:hypothetical protein